MGIRNVVIVCMSSSVYGVTSAMKSGKPNALKSPVNSFPLDGGH